MDWSIVILIVAVAAVAYFVWNQRKGAGDSTATTGSAGPSAAATPPRPATPAAATPTSGASPLASYDEYRRVNPSHMVYNKLTCNRCGSNMIKTSGGTALCGNCGAALYRA
jgi:hypothetical protein